MLVYWGIIIGAFLLGLIAVLLVIAGWSIRAGESGAVLVAVRHTRLAHGFHYLGDGDRAPERSPGIVEPCPNHRSG